MVPVCAVVFQAILEIHQTVNNPSVGLIPNVEVIWPVSFKSAKVHVGQAFVEQTQFVMSSTTMQFALVFLDTEVLLMLLNTARKVSLLSLLNLSLKKESFAHGYHQFSLQFPKYSQLLLTRVIQTLVETMLPV
jgi:hypothetical protein